mgnify:CR=1 FL=1
MKTKHTPGPWKVTELDWDSSDTYINPSRETGEFALICRMTGSHAHKNANARLIAAAPELLEALEEALTAPFGLVRGDDARKQTDFVTKARAAIAKAKGET